MRFPAWVKLILVGALALTISTAASGPISAEGGLCAGNASDSGPCNVVQGTRWNRVQSGHTGGTVAGGGDFDLANIVTGDYGTIAGGQANQAAEQASVAGGAFNRAQGYRSVVSGGAFNTAVAAYATVAGGTNNSAGYIDATIGGGENNESSGRGSTVAGGMGNVANFTLATVGGGGYNTATSIAATASGGDRNTASAPYAVVGGGGDNRATAFNAAIAGGSGNSASADNGTIGGGLANRVTDKYGTVGGGNENVAGNGNDTLIDARYATVGGGTDNHASGAFSTVPGGSSNTAGGDYSFAAGHRATIHSEHAGAILFADSNDVDFTSAAANEFAVRASGGVRLVTGIDTAGNPNAGVRLASGGGSWMALSDRNSKANVAAVDRQAILQELAAIPITTWNYLSQDPAIRHIGPMAQDFSRLHVGEDQNYINMMDANGVALAAIQALYDETQSQEARISKAETDNAALRARVDELEHQVAGMHAAEPSSSADLTWKDALIGAVGLIALVAFFRFKSS